MTTNAGIGTNRLIAAAIATDVGTRIEGIGDDERQDGRIESIPPLSPVADDGWEAPRLRL